MEIRNPKLIYEGIIECEINHPEFGWLPFTASIHDIEEIGREVYEKALAMNPEKGEPPVFTKLIPNLSFGQLLYGLITEGLLTPEEANDWLTNKKLPTLLGIEIAKLKPADQILTTAKALQITEISRSDNLIEMIGRYSNKTSDDLDEFFIKYSVF